MLLGGAEAMLLFSAPSTTSIAIVTGKTGELDDLYKSLKESPHVVVQKVNDVRSVDLRKIDAVVAPASVSDPVVEVVSRDSDVSTRVSMLIGSATDHSKNDALARLKISDEHLVVFEVNDRDIHEEKTSSGSASKAIVLAFVLVSAAYYFLIGAMMSPALVLCEEIEKTTICTTLLSGVDRGTVVAVKLLTIMIVGTLSVFTYMAGSGALLGIAVAIILSAITRVSILPQGFSSPLNTMIFFLNLLFFSALVSGTNLICATLARTVKAAQSILPVPFLVISLMAVLVCVPDLVLDRRTLFIPFLNCFLLAKTVLLDNVNGGMATTVLFETFALTAIELKAIQWIFGREEFIFGTSLFGKRFFK